MSAQFRVIHLHGAAGEKFGSPYRFAADTPREALSALIRQKPGFKKFVEQADWRIVRGPLDRGMDSDIEMLGLRFGTVTELHLIPVASGAGRGKSIGKVVLGVALVGASLVTAGAAAGAGVGLGAALGGEIGIGGITFANVLVAGIGLAICGTSRLMVSK
jgi:predicted phage tail protein